MIEPINLLLPVSTGFGEEDSTPKPVSTDEDFHSFLMKQRFLPEKKASGQSGQSANEQVSSMTMATHFPQIAAQQDVPPSAASSDAPSPGSTCAMPIPFDLTEHPTVTPFLFFSNQQETSTDPIQGPPSLEQKSLISSPSGVEEPPPVPSQSDLMLNQNGRISGLPFFRDSIDPERIESEAPGLMEPRKVMAQPQLFADGNPIVSVHSKEMGPLRQTLSAAGSPDPIDPLRIIPQSRPVSNEEGLYSENPSLAQSLDRAPIGSQFSGLQKPPVEIIDSVATELPKPAEMMTAGEQNPLNPDETLIVDPQNREIFMAKVEGSGDEESSSLLQKDPVAPRVTVEQGIIREHFSRNPISSEPAIPADEALFHPFVIRRAIPIHENKTLQREEADVRMDSKSIEAIQQRTERPLFPPEVPSTAEKRIVGDPFQQEASRIEKPLWDEGRSPVPLGTKDPKDLDHSWVFTDQKKGLELQSNVPKEIQEGQEHILPRTERFEIYQQIAKKVVWSIKNNEEKIKLTLEPPELGNIYMEINREERNIRTTLWADNPATKGILEANQIQFYRILEKDGFHLEKFSVFIQQESGSFQERGENSIEYGRWGRGKDQEEKGSFSKDPFEISTVMNLPHGGSQYVDLFV